MAWKLVIKDRTFLFMYRGTFFAYYRQPLSTKYNWIIYLLPRKEKYTSKAYFFFSLIQVCFIIRIHKTGIKQNSFFFWWQVINDCKCKHYSHIFVVMLLHAIIMKNVKFPPYLVLENAKVENTCLKAFNFKQ